MLAPIDLLCARVPQSGCNGDFVIDGGGTGGTLGIVHRTVPCLGARLCIRIPTYVVLVVHCMGHASVPASWLGQHSRKQAVFWDVGGSTRGSMLVRVRVRTYAARELRFSGMIPSQRLKGRLLRIVLTLVRTDDDCVR